MGAEPAAGWFPDPHGADSQRWWDGTQWTDHVTPAAATTPDAAAVEPAQAAESAAPVPQLRVAGLQPTTQSPFLDAPAVATVDTPVTQHAVRGGDDDGSFRPSAPKPKNGGMSFAILGTIIAMSVGTAIRNTTPSTADVALNKSFTTPDGALTVQLPSAPVAEPKTERLMGYTLSYNMYSSDLGKDRGLIGVAYVDYDHLIAQLPKSRQEEARASLSAFTVLQGAAQGAATATNGTVAKSTPTMVGGYPAVDVTIERKEPGVADARIIYVEKEAALYTVMVMTRDGDTDLFSRVAKTMTLKAPTRTAA